MLKERTQSGSETEPEISWSGVTKRFTAKGRTTVALRDVSFDVAHGEFIAIVGPSGCGKTTLLSLAAGLSKPSRGTVKSRGINIDDVNTKVGYVTQRDTILPWRDVQANVALALEIRGYSKSRRDEDVSRIIDMVGLKGFEHHYPYQLSGGMLKRVLLARTLVYEPSVLLLDEPFAALDAQLRFTLQGELLRIWASTNLTVVLVTHDLDEAVALADRIIILKGAPATVAAIVSVPLPRPRDPMTVRFEPEFTAVVRNVWETMVGPIGVAS